MKCISVQNMIYFIYFTSLKKLLEMSSTICRRFFLMVIFGLCRNIVHPCCPIFLPDSEYDVEFQTAAEENAGTDASVYFQMIGEDGESQEIELKNKEGGYFNRGQLDRFRIRARDVGRVSWGNKKIDLQW